MLHLRPEIPQPLKAGLLRTYSQISHKQNSEFAHRYRNWIIPMKPGLFGSGGICLTLADQKPETAAGIDQTRRNLQGKLKALYGTHGHQVSLPAAKALATAAEDRYVGQSELTRLPRPETPPSFHLTQSESRSPWDGKWPMGIPGKPAPEPRSTHSSRPVFIQKRLGRKIALTKMTSHNLIGIANRRQIHPRVPLLKYIDICRCRMELAFRKAGQRDLTVRQFWRYPSQSIVNECEFDG